MALPGLFPAIRNNRQWLVDGGLVDPVPVAACRALGADIVIGVNLNAGLLRKRSVKESAPEPAPDNSVLETLKKQAKEYSNSLFASDDDEDKAPGLFFTIAKAIDIFQDRITRSRLAGDPADVLLSPRVGDIGMLEFQRAGEAIAEGEASVQRAINEIQDLTTTREQP